MKKSSIPMSTLVLAILSLLNSCSKFLDQDVFTQYDPSQILRNQDGIESLLFAAYSDLQSNGSPMGRDFTLVMNEFPGEAMFDWGGGFINQAGLYMDFTWDSQEQLLPGIWSLLYRSIRNANSVLDNIHFAEKSIPQTIINTIETEAKFIRAADYYLLWSLFGPVPLVTTNDSLNLEPTRPTEEAFDNFLINEFRGAAQNLPLNQEMYGRATKGAALAMLGEFLLNNHQWEESYKINKEVMDLDVYSLYNGAIKSQFSVENEENNSIIFSSPASPTLHPNVFMAHMFPLNYQLQSNWQSFASQFTVYNDWFKTYDLNDKRREWFLTEYTDKLGVYHNLLDITDSSDGVRCFKYFPDPNGINANMGNDQVIIRYAEVLLNRSEALNEINGPNQESVDLLNQIRNRAGVSEFALIDFPTKQSLREALLEERGWEFICEGKRRMDLIRQGELIPKALERGKHNAKDYMVRYPIPQNEIDANPNLKQNTGY